MNAFYDLRYETIGSDMWMLLIWIGYKQVSVERETALMAKEVNTVPALLDGKEGAK